MINLNPVKALVKKWTKRERGMLGKEAEIHKVHVAYQACAEIVREVYGDMMTQEDWEKFILEFENYMRIDGGSVFLTMKGELLGANHSIGFKDERIKSLCNELKMYKDAYGEYIVEKEGE